MSTQVSKPFWILLAVSLVILLGMVVWWMSSSVAAPEPLQREGASPAANPNQPVVPTQNLPTTPDAPGNPPELQ